MKIRSLMQALQAHLIRCQQCEAVLDYKALQEQAVTLRRAQPKKMRPCVVCKAPHAGKSKTCGRECMRVLQSQRQTERQRLKAKSVAIILLCLVLSACGFPAWRNHALRDVVEVRWYVNPEQVQGSGQPSQTIEYYDAAGRHLGYGTTSGGA